MAEPLYYRSATELSQLMRAGELSARETVSAHLERIDEVNPDVNAIVTYLPEAAMEQAAAADQRFASGGWDGPLHGIPVAHKDNHLTMGVRTTFGSRIHEHYVPELDDLVVERMKAAGVVTLGKTNVPEFVAGGHTFNDLFGATRNPYDLAVTAGGSSGGAAAALAAGMHPIADGNDMGGSLRLPAGYCNVVGLRPSAGRVPTYPASDGWCGLSVQGPMARCVDDVALLLSVMAGPDGRSPLSLEEPGSRFATVAADGLRGRRIAFSVDLGGTIPVDPEVRRVVERAAHTCREAGAIVEEACISFDGAGECFRTLRAWQFEAALGDLFDANREWVRPSLYENMLAGRRLSGRDVGRAARLRTELFHRMREFLETYDGLLLPVSPLPAFDVDLQYPASVCGVQQPDYLGWMESACHVTVTGHPVISLPAGFSEAGTPLGIQLVGRHRAEDQLLDMAKDFEQRTRHAWTRPRSGASVDHRPGDGQRD
ncbi:amidase [Rhodococcus koreensis]|uniref:Amidase n=1 Tax=Rhodococcus koreensis TaxID=99653 RepID=A0A1H4SLX8_9NOCA|nr:amidase [Rhodococcus koreensis]SEC45040.1 amidase [Rhodococcus koreensis]